MILNPAELAGGRPAIRQPTRLPLQKLHGKHVALLVAAFFALLATKSQAAEVIPPKPDRYFNDYADVISKSAALRFNEQLAQFERETSDQVVVAIFPKMQSESDIADYTQRVAQAWGVGQKERRNGVVLFVFIQDRKMFIQVGYGLEGALPDVTAFDITEYKIKPHFRSGDYEGGIAAGIDSIFKAIRGEYKGSGKTVAEQHRSGGAISLFYFVFFFIVFVVVLSVISALMRPLSGYGYSSRRGGPIFFPTGGGGGGWSSGNGGGGGFSGFSGGGGSFGGGGAGSSW
ncbi:MAG TPA: TPM domain-containing protein [Candidatus Udaeobacter sp.]|nr:TPM domain-containing protein [Candidatus Udaeobacter sp.]